VLNERSPEASNRRDEQEKFYKSGSGAHKQNSGSSRGTSRPFRVPILDGNLIEDGVSNVLALQSPFMNTPSSLPADIQQLAASETNKVLAALDKEQQEILRTSSDLLEAARQSISDDVRRQGKEILDKLKEKDRKPWQLFVATVPVVATALLGLFVWWLQLGTNRQIDRSSKQLSTRLALTEEFYKRRFTIYDGADKQMIQLLAAVRNLDRNPNDADKKKEAVILLTRLNVSSRTNGLYMTADVSNGLLEVWSTATKLPQLNRDGKQTIDDLSRDIAAVEAQMKKELLVNIEPVSNEN
jgi:hypothetical protein